MGSDDYYYHHCCCFLAIILVLLLIQVHGDSSDDLIQKTCKNTKYYDLCVSSLKSDSTSSKASDTKGLTQIMVRVGVANATATKSYISSLIGTSTNDTSATAASITMKKLLRDCADKYSYAGNALLAPIQDMDAEMYDYAYMHVMAAADYPNACHNGFRRYPGLAYPRQLAIREQGFKRICDVVMEMLDSLAL